LVRDGRSNVPAAAASTLGAENVAATSFQCYGALAVGLTLVFVALIAVLFGRGPGPVVKPLVPLAAGIWSLADLLTAFLLLAQFYVNGRRFLGLLAVAYAITGLIAWPYLCAFPGLFQTRAPTVADEQISIWLWSIWHCAFPVLIIIANTVDAALGRVVSRREIRATTGMFASVPIVIVAATATVIILGRHALPHLVVAGHFDPGYRAIFLPAVIGLNGLACIVLLRPRRLTSLNVCLALAVFSALLDASLNLTSNAYSYAWDASKVITVFTSGVVLFMMLFDIAGIYGRLERVANVDVLTSVANRRAFDQRMNDAFLGARRTGSSLSLLVIDIDFFKRYNDSFGHSGGDECLRGVAKAIAECVTRPLDFVARFGGEEFVVVLPDTPLHGVLTLAERIRSIVAELDVVQEGKALGRVTVSIGVSDVRDAGRVADRALYEAKRGGRNRVVLGRTDIASTPGNELLAVPNAADLGFADEN
jgi:diguanylate cyclase (GGDEF)-like protein